MKRLFGWCRKLRQRLHDWYQGKYIPPPPNYPFSRVIFVGPGYYEQPLLAKLLRTLGWFWLEHWKWIIGFTVTVLGLLVAWARLKH